jgi:hypothetical protein
MCEAMFQGVLVDLSWLLRAYLTSVCTRTDAQTHGKYKKTGSLPRNMRCPTRVWAALARIFPNLKPGPHSRLTLHFQPRELAPGHDPRYIQAVLVGQAAVYVFI